MDSAEILKEMAMRNARADFVMGVIFVLVLAVLIVWGLSLIDPKKFVDGVIEWKKSLNDLRKRWNEGSK